jgi:pantoate--beta-alanine ligase
MQLITSIHDMKVLSRQIRDAGKTLGLVPTMGALHEGHFSLIRRAKSQCDATVVSIFVNPTQFGPSEDFDRYPRDPERDVELLRPFKLDAVFTPSVEEMYPQGFGTFVEPGPLATRWEGASRPGHFRGVTTVVLKLFHVVSPDFAYFGQKDFQQAMVILRLVRDLNLDVRLVLCPIIRDSDGVAISSRNVYLSAEERQSARLLNKSLRRAQELVWGGETRAECVQAEIKRILQADPKVSVDYVAVVDSASLNPVDRISQGCVGLIAARVGSTRLIDNVIFGSREASQEELLQVVQGSSDQGINSHAPGLEVESVRLEIQECRDCAAISSMILPPREFLLKYVKTDYPNLNAVRVLVVGRDAPWNPENYLYRHPEIRDRFAAGLFGMLNVKNLAEFKTKFALTDALRCHSIVTPVPGKALANCARHLRKEFGIFPNLRVLILMGEAPYLQFQQFILERDLKEIVPFNDLLSNRGWSQEEVRLSMIPNRSLQVIYCQHPVAAYCDLPALAHLLQLDLD